jgi:hypothetical protein
LNGFKTEPDSNNPYAFNGRTESGERFAWNGFFSLDPLKSEGRLDLENLVLPKYHPYYRDQVAFELREGTATIRASYAFQWTEGNHLCRVKDASLDVHGLKIGEVGKLDPPLVLPIIEARSVQADVLSSSAEIGSLALRDGALEVQRLRDGQISLVKLLAPKPQPKKENEQPFKLILRELALKGFRVAFEDQSTSRPVKTLLEDVNLRLQDFDLDPAHSTKLSAETRVNGRGKLIAEGMVAALKPSFDLNVKAENLDLQPFDSYMEPSLDIRVNRGALNVDGRVKGAFEGKKSDFVSFQGNSRLDNFEVMDGAQKEPFLRYTSLRLSGMDVRTNPEVLKIQAVDLIEPENRLVVSADGSSNVARALKIEPVPGPSPATPTGAAIATVAPPTQGMTFQVSIAKVRIQGGKLAFIDRSLEPNAALMITEMEGTYTGLSTKPETQSVMELKGKAGGLAPIIIQGRAMPLRHDKDTDVTLKIQGADLSDFGPYAGKYLGYTIRKGKLEVDAHLRIQERKLEIQDKVRMDQFYLGDKTQSPDATHLPVKLALALLRDRKGLIELELPISGSLDDPDFHYGKIVWHTITNVLTKLVTSPFALLGKLFGGGDRDLSFATFEPGSAVPDAELRKKAEILARSLVERPDLSLEVEGTVDPGTDGAAIKKQALEGMLRQEKSKAIAAENQEEDLEKVSMEPHERETWLKVVFEAAFPPPKPEQGKENVQIPPPPPAEMEQRLLGTLTVTPGELRQLADARTKAVVQLLLQDGKIEASRIFEVEGGERAKKEGGSRVYFTVK